MSLVFDFQNLEVKSRGLFVGHGNSVDAAKFHPTDPARFASGSHDHSIWLWDVSKEQPVSKIPAQNEGIWSLDWSHDGRLLLSTGPAGTVYLTDPATGKPVRSFPGGLQKGYCAKFLPNSTDFIVCGQNGAISRFGVDAEKPKCSVQVPDTIVYSWQSIPDCQQVMASTNKGDFLVLNADLSLAKTISVSKHEIRAFGFLKNQLYTSFQTGDLKTMVWDAAKADLTLKGENKGHRADTTSLLVAPNRNLVFTGAKDSSVFSWNATTGQATHHLVGHRDQIADLTINCSGDVVVTASWDQTLRAYTLADIAP